MLIVLNKDIDSILLLFRFGLDSLATTFCIVFLALYILLLEDYKLPAFQVVVTLPLYPDMHHNHLIANPCAIARCTAFLIEYE